MLKIKSISFDKNGLKDLEKHPKGKDWPVVYLICNDKDLYIGETTSAVTRMQQHLNNPEKSKLNEMKIIIDDTFNKSVILDFEQKLIKYCSADKKFMLLNKNAGQSSSHDYYNRKAYYNNFRELWGILKNCHMVQHSIDVLENQSMFKYSPYNSLTDEQNLISIKVLNDICEKFEKKQTGISLINGGAGTGKTVLAISMINSLINAINLDESSLTLDELNSEKVKVLLKLKEYIKKNKTFKIGFVFPMSGIRKTIEKVFAQSGNGLKKDIIISPYNLAKNEYDILFVDEAHRLKNRINLSGGPEYKQFDETCKSMNLDPQNSTQLDWIMKKAKYKVLFYDKDQTVKSSDITHCQLKKALHDAKQSILDLNLEMQMRCVGGEKFIDYLKNIMNCKQKDFEEMDNNYDFKIFDNVEEMVDSIRQKDDENSLSKVVAGFSWEWKTKPAKVPKDDLDYYNSLKKNDLYDMDINGNKYIWNFVTEDWISRKDSHYTIGCIHSTQGFDMNYVGVIFGREIDYDPQKNEIVINLDKFYDTKVKDGCDALSIKKYIINTYVTMMARGINGCYVFAYNKKLQDYLKKFIKKGVFHG